MSSVASVADPVADALGEVERIQAAIAAAEEAMETASGDAAEFARAITAADDLEGAVALGEVDAGEVARARGEAVTGQQEATGTYQRHRAALQALRTRVPVAERAVDEARLERVTGLLAPAGERRHAASATVAKRVKALDAAGAELVEARAAVEELERMAAMVAERIQVDAPLAVDEAGWPVDDLPSLMDLGTGGPRTPAADRERREAETAKNSAEWDERAVRHAAHEVAIGHDSALEQLPEHLHAAAIAKAHELYDEANERAIAEDERRKELLRQVGAEGAGTTTMAEQIQEQEASLIAEAADALADRGVDENAPALQRVPPWLRPKAIAKAQAIRRDRLREFERRQAELRAEAETAEVR